MITANLVDKIAYWGLDALPTPGAMTEFFMSDRTQLAIGRNAISVPKFTKRAVEAAIGTGLTASVALFILVLNNVLTGRGGWIDGFNVWQSFIRQPAILGTMFMTALVTVLFLAWQRDRGMKR
jgi:hypothetical protein